MFNSKIRKIYKKARHFKSIGYFNKSNYQMSPSLCIELNNYSNERVYFYIYGILQVGSGLKGYIGHKRIIFFKYNDEKILTVIKN